MYGFSTRKPASQMKAFKSFFLIFFTPQHFEEKYVSRIREKAKAS